MTHSGNKYHRQILPRQVGESAAVVDVYCVLEAFDVRCPAIQHAVKKLLCCGVRGKGAVSQDLSEARDAISRAIELAEQRKEANAAALKQHH